jgi:hypothetical protein
MNENVTIEQQIFETAQAIQDDLERNSFISKRCGGDPRRIERIQRLVGNAATADKFFDIPEFQTLVEPDRIGMQIGAYKIVRRVGAGGEGVVYAAEQLEPVRRTVALKLMKFGLQSSEAVARFLAERQTLAMMEHANIARIYDAGATDKGEPYFVMELVEGVRITDFCDQKRLSIGERLRLFTQLCQAVQHAHQKGIIHRDLKPSNVLVTEKDGTVLPKIIDFGIAKAVQEVSAPAADLEATFHLEGTLAYMSPEQAAGADDIDTRSDIYSLGALLFELVAGKPVFDLRPLNVSAGRDVVKLQKPVAPNIRFAQLPIVEQAEIANVRSTNISKLNHTLAGDLGLIVLKCLEKERSRRYETVRDVAEDLKCLLQNEPVLAHAPDRAYRFRKFITRNKTPVGAGAIASMTLVTALAVIANALFNERAALKDAETAKLRERHERLRAEAGELSARRFAYASDMNMAQQALDMNNRGRALELLSRSVPTRNEQDLRGWEWNFLSKTARSAALATLAQDGASIFSVAFTSTGEIVSRDGAFQIVFRDAAGNGIEGFQADGYGRALTVVSNFVIYSDVLNQTNPVIKLRRLTPSVSTTAFSCEAPPLSLTCSADGHFLVGICHDEKMRVWDMRAQKLLATFSTAAPNGWHKGATAISSDGELIAFGETDGRLILVETKSFGVVTNFTASNEGITALAFSPDGLLASSSGFTNKSIQIWRPKQAELIRTLEGHGAWVASLAFSPNGDKLASGSGDQTIGIWNTRDWKRTAILRGHSDEVYSLSFSTDGKRLLSASKSGELLLWDPGVVRGENSFDVFPNEVFKFAFLKSSPAILVLRRDGKLTLADARHPFRQEQLGNVESDGEIAVNATSTSAAVADHKGNLKVLDLSKKAVAKILQIRPGPPVYVAYPPAAPDRLILMDFYREVHIWTTNDWTEIITSQADRDINVAAVSPDGAFLATGSIYGTVQLLDAATGKILRTVNAHRRTVTGINFSPDGKLLVTASEDALAKLWRVPDLAVEATLKGHLLGVHSAAFSPDGRRVITGSHDKQAVKVWDVSTHQELLTLRGTGSFFYRSEFSPTGQTVAAVNAQGALLLWNAESP